MPGSHLGKLKIVINGIYDEKNVERLSVVPEDLCRSNTLRYISNTNI